MTLRWRTIFATLAFSVVAGLLGSRLGIQRAIEIFPGPVSGAINLALKQTVHGALELSEEQENILAEIERKNELKRIQLRAEAKHATQAFARAMRVAQDNFSESRKIVLAIDQMSAASRALNIQAVSYADEVRKILTPEQRAVADETIEKFIINIAERS